MKVIICDDQAIVRDGLTMLLKLEPDIQIIGTASEGATAVELVDKENPDLVLMDLKMPVLDGYEAAKQIKALLPKLPIIAQTAHALTTDRDKVKKEGFAGYISKPIKIEELLAIVDKYKPL